MKNLKSAVTILSIAGLLSASFLYGDGHIYNVKMNGTGEVKQIRLNPISEKNVNDIYARLMSTSASRNTNEGLSTFARMTETSTASAITNPSPQTPGSSDVTFNASLESYILSMPILNQGGYGFCHDFATVAAADILEASSNNISTACDANNNYTVNTAEDTYNVSFLPGLEVCLDLQAYYKYCKTLKVKETPTTPYTWINDNWSSSNIPIEATDGGNFDCDSQVISKFGLIKSSFEMDRESNMTSRAFFPSMPGAIDSKENQVPVAVYSPTNFRPSGTPEASSNPTSSDVNTYITNYKNKAILLPSFTYKDLTIPKDETVAQLNGTIEQNLDSGNLVGIEMTLFPNYPSYDASQAGSMGMLGTYYPQIPVNSSRNSSIVNSTPDVWLDTTDLDTYATNVLNPSSTFLKDNNLTSTNDLYGNHAVLIVGYIPNVTFTSKDGTSYTTTLYMIENSWGVTNGDYGYDFVDANYLFTYGCGIGVFSNN